MHNSNTNRVLFAEAVAQLKESGVDVYGFIEDHGGPMFSYWEADVADYIKEQS